MALYKYNTSGVFSEIKEKPFKLERDIQRMFETNMSEIMGLEMIKSEFTIKDRRIDTLAFDPQSKSFVIIEYKRERNSSVIDQGFTYRICCQRTRNKRCYLGASLYLSWIPLCRSQRLSGRQSRRFRCRSSRR